MRRTARHMNRADQMISIFGEAIKARYGFIADPSLPLWRNVEKRIGELTYAYFDRPSNMSCHVHLRDLPDIQGVEKLLGLGLNYCIKEKVETTTKKTFERLRADVRRIYHLRDNEEDGEYIKGLYIKSDYKFKEASKEIEQAMNDFEKAVAERKRAAKHRQKIYTNLTHHQWALVETLHQHDDYIVVPADKNLGPCLLDREVYIERGCSEHLGNSTNYKLLSKANINTKMAYLRYQLWHFLGKFYQAPIYAARNGEEPDVVGISKAENTYLIRAYKKCGERIARFRMTMKVHKTPWKMRPIVACSGTWMNAWSKWLDYWLQKLKHQVPTHTRDSQQLLDELAELNLPPNAILVTADANSMYNNIDTDHAIEVITWWLEEMAESDSLPPNFPLEAVQFAMKCIMRNNIFEWGDLYFLQLLGTAMGTSAAVMWATLYFGYHEVHTLIPKYSNNLLYFRRFIDDMFIIWLRDDTDAWPKFCADVNDFGILTWEIEEQSTTVDFLDLTLTIDNGRITSRTFQKKMNLYLYLPPASAHSGNVLKGMIYGLVRRYKAQNTYRKDYIHFVRLLFRRLLARGWKREYIHPLVMEACNRLEISNTTQHEPTNDANENEMLFLHFVFHPDDISRLSIRQLYNTHCQELFEAELDVARPTIAYSRPRNIGDLVSQTKLHQAPGHNSSSIMGKYKQGLAP